MQRFFDVYGRFVGRRPLVALGTVAAITVLAIIGLTLTEPQADEQDAFLPDGSELIAANVSLATSFPDSAGLEAVQIVFRGDVLTSWISITLTVEELAAATDLSPEELEALETYGLIESRSLGPATYYDGEALAVAKMAAGFKEFGVEARHLRMFRIAAEREAGVYEQVVLPLIKQRNPEATRRSREQLEQMAKLGAQLRGAMIRQALRSHVG